MGAVEGETDIIERIDELLRLDSKHVWTDVAAFHDALDSARRAEGPEAHLREAVDLYRADFCQGAYDWSEPFAKRLRDGVIDAAMRLADLLERREDVDSALDVIDRAITADQYAEHLYRRGMELEAKRGRRDAVVRRFRRLEELLAKDLEVSPEDATLGVQEARGLVAVRRGCLGWCDRRLGRGAKKLSAIALSYASPLGSRSTSASS